MKYRNVFFLIAAITIVDQALKFYIKLHYHLGEEHKILGDWFRLHFVENEGMAWGWTIGGGFGKIILTVFRLVAVIGGSFLLKDFIKKKYHTGFLVCASLIYAGALGNLLDSMFYGLIFEESRGEFWGMGVANIARLVPFGKGYANFLHGKVVDMLYFPLIEDAHYPNWVPFLGGKIFTFFEPVFNVADASISVGVISLLLFQNKFLKKHNEKQAIAETPVNTAVAEENNLS